MIDLSEAENDECDADCEHVCDNEPVPRVQWCCQEPPTSSGQCLPPTVKTPSLLQPPSPQCVSRARYMADRQRLSWQDGVVTPPEFNKTIWQSLPIVHPLMLNKIRGSSHFVKTDSSSQIHHRIWLKLFLAVFENWLCVKQNILWCWFCFVSVGIILFLEFSHFTANNCKTSDFLQMNHKLIIMAGNDYLSIGILFTFCWK